MRAEQNWTCLRETTEHDISDSIKNGNNEIAVEIAGTLFNLNGSNWIEGVLGKDFIGPETFIDFDNYTEEYSFIALGIEIVDIISEYIE